MALIRRLLSFSWLIDGANKTLDAIRELCLVVDLVNLTFTQLWMIYHAQSGNIYEVSEMYLQLGGKFEGEKRLTRRRRRSCEKRAKPRTNAVSTSIRILCPFQHDI